MTQFRLLGSFDVHSDGAPTAVHLGAHGRQLLSFLLSFPNQAHRRERLADLFWPELDPERARSTLNTAVWRIRRALHALPDCFVVSVASGPREVRLSLTDENLVDIHRFVRFSEAQFEARDAHAELHAVVQLYRGPYLDGDDNDWIVPHRERFHCLYIRVLSDLMRRFARDRRLEDALDCGRRILTADPLREQVHREVILLYMLNGQSAQALRQFDRCADVLRDECNVEPMPETVNLVSLIRKGTIFSQMASLTASTFPEDPKTRRPGSPARFEGPDS